MTTLSPPPRRRDRAALSRLDAASSAVGPLIRASPADRPSSGQLDGRPVRLPVPHPPRPAPAPWWLWLCGVVLAALPLVVTSLAVPSRDPKQAASTLVGVLALVAMAWALVLASRQRRLTRTVGIDRVIGWHRHLGVAAAVLVGVHVGLAVAADPHGFALLDPFTTTLAARPAMVATVTVCALGLTHRLARRPGARYRRWQRVHLGLAVVVVVEATAHVVLLHRLTGVPAAAAWLTGLAVIVLGVLGNRWLVRPLRRRGAHLVYGVRRETDDVYTLTLVPTDPGRALHPEPGQFVWLRLRRRALGVEEHPFTIASSAAATNRLELTIRAAGPFTRSLAGIPRGVPVWLDGPYGAYTAAAGTAAATVTVAGGVGITPAMSLLRTLADHHDPRPHHLLLAARPGEELFLPELAGLTGRLNLTVHQLRGRRVSAALLASLLPGPQTGIAYYVTGSPAMISAAVDALTAYGADPHTITSESFGRHHRPAPDRAHPIPISGGPLALPARSHTPGSRR